MYTYTPRTVLVENSLIIADFRLKSEPIDNCRSLHYLVLHEALGLLPIVVMQINVTVYQKTNGKYHM